MSGAGPSRCTQSCVGVSADKIRSAPRESSVAVFFLEESSAELTPCFLARSNSVGARSRSAVSMYSSLPLRSSKYEFPVMPCCSGNTPQQMDALLVLVTEGIVPLTRRKRPCSRHRASTGMSLWSRYSSPNPSNISTIVRWGARCGVRWAKAAAPSRHALDARNSRRFSFSPNNLWNQFAGDIRQPHVAAVVSIRQLGVFDAQQSQDRGVQVMIGDRLFFCLVADLIRRSDRLAALDSRPRHPNGHRARVMVASDAVLGERHAAKFGMP